MRHSTWEPFDGDREELPGPFQSWDHDEIPVWPGSETHHAMLTQSGQEQYATLMGMRYLYQANQEVFKLAYPHLVGEFTFIYPSYCYELQARIFGEVAKRRQARGIFEFAKIRKNQFRRLEQTQKNSK